MNKNSTEEEFGIAVERFLNAYKDFRKAAKKLISIMESMNKEIYQEPKKCLDETNRIHKFIIKALDDTGHIQEHPFGIRYVADKEKKQE